MEQKPDQFQGESYRHRFSFYMMAIGSALGLANIWRFPYVLGENGGGAFLLLYVFLSFTVGLSILIGELILGQHFGFSFLKILKLTSAQKNKSFHWVARFALVITIIILAYYSVISGWVLHYLTRFVMGLFQSNHQQYISRINMEALLKSGFMQFALASVHLLVCVFIVLKNVTERFEKIFARILPFFVLLVLVFLFRSFSMDSTPDVLRFLFYPDFSKLNLSSLGKAIGHVLYTLSLGMGIMVTFGSYFKRDENLPGLGFRVAMIDTIVSIVAVLIVFPVVFLGSGWMSGGMHVAEPGLLFDSLPLLFSRMKYGEYFGLAFFLCLWLVALNASIALFETLIANLSEKLKTQNRTILASLILVGVLSITVVPAFLSEYLSKLNIMDLAFIEIVDSLLINYLLPLSTLGFIFSLFISMSKQEMKERFVSEKGKSSQAMFSHWIWLLKWFSPIMIGLGIVLQIVYLVIKYF